MKTNKAKNLTQILNNVKTGIKVILAAGSLACLLAGCTGTVTPPINGEKDAVDLNTPEVEMTLVGATPAVTFIELANYNNKLMGVGLIDFLVEYGQIKSYKSIIENTEKMGMEWFLGYYTKNQVRQSIKNGYPGIALQHSKIEQKSWIYRIIDGFDDFGEFFNSNDPYNGNDFKIPYSDWEKYNYKGSKYVDFFIIYNSGEDPFKDFSDMPVEIEDWPYQLPPDVFN